MSSFLRNLLTPKDEVVYFDVNTVDKGHHQVKYRGISALRCPFDYVIYQMIVTELKPDLIIEIGTKFGGGTLYLADLMNSIDHGTIHSIDILDQTSAVVKDHPRIKLFTKGWEEYDLSLTQGYGKIMIIEDASHIYEDTLAAMEKFAAVVTKDSYFIIEDGIIDAIGKKKYYRGGPLKAIREFLPHHPEYIVDRKWCNLFGKNATFNVNGYLKRTS